jgi:CRISPR/Cas system type I-B associated protein Csh2 (Cas7 group RAMP superfamily)
LVTTPAIEIFGEAFMFIEKVAVSVTWPVVIMLSESLEVMARVAGDVVGGTE